MLVAALAILAMAWQRWRAMVLSPLLLLPLIIVMFFSIGPAAYIAFDIYPSYLRSDIRPAVVQYLSGPAELLALHFASLLLLGGSMLARWVPHPAPLAIMPRWLGWLALMLLGGLVSILVAQRLSPGMAELMHSGIGLQMLHGIPPWISFAVALLTWLAMERESWRRVAVAAGIVGVASLLSIPAAKAAAFIGVSCLLLYVVTMQIRGRALWGATLMAAGIVLLSLLALAEFRYHQISSFLQGSTHHEAPAFPILGRVAEKLMTRQAETVGCFSNVVDRRLHSAPEASPLYFVAGLVPRAVWPNKPSLSRGDEFALLYCDMPHESVYSDRGIHSASVTVLGEPVIMAGRVGLVTAEIALVIALVALTATLLRMGRTGLITLAALLPWLIDFDQSLSLYFANAAKMLLYILPGVLVLLTLDTIAGRRAAAG